MPGIGSSLVKQPTVSQSAKPGHLNGQCLREKSSYPDWTADEPRGKQVHERQALEVAHWLQAHPQVKQVFHPALHDHPGHALWRRDFTGSNGLLSFELRETDAAYKDQGRAV